MYFGNNKSTPYLFKGNKQYSCEDVLQTLHTKVDRSRICTKTPVTVQENAAFVIDTSLYKSRNDYLIDKFGSFRNLGYSGKLFRLSNEGEVLYSETLPRQAALRPNLEENEVLLKTTYWRHKEHKDFTRRTYKLESILVPADLVLLQYIYTGESNPVSPHKKFTMAPSVKAVIREKVQGPKNPGTIYDEVFRESGGDGIYIPIPHPQKYSANQV